MYLIGMKWINEIMCQSTLSLSLSSFLLLRVGRNLSELAKLTKPNRPKHDQNQLRPPLLTSTISFFFSIILLEKKIDISGIRAWFHHYYSSFLTNFHSTMDTRGKMNEEFNNEVNEILGRHESKFDQINVVIQAILIKL